MSNKLYDETSIQNIANAIREKGITGTMTVSQMAGKILDIPSGGTLIAKTITQNGTYNASDDNADGYSQVTVDVSGGGGHEVQITYEESVNGDNLNVYDGNDTSGKRVASIVSSSDSQSELLVNVSSGFLCVKPDMGWIVNYTTSGNINYVSSFMQRKLFSVTGDGSLSVSTSCCFTPDTLILMSDGTYKQIIDVQVGDSVRCWDEEIHEVTDGIVERTITNEYTTDMARITFIDGTSVEFNAYHPLYTQDGWKSLTGYDGLPVLTATDTLLSSDGECIIVASIDRWTCEPITTYNLDIEECDNFFVSHGGVSVLAKNDC